MQCNSSVFCVSVRIVLLSLAVPCFFILFKAALYPTTFGADSVKAEVPETSDGLLDDTVIQALVEDVGQSSNGGTPGHGEQVMVIAAWWEV